MRRPVSTTEPRSTLHSQLHCLRRHLLLGAGRGPRERLDHVAVPVPCREVHRRVRVVRVGPQRALHSREPLDEVAPVYPVESAERGDRVADRDLVRGLHAGLHLDHLLDGLAHLGEPLLDPGQGQGQGWRPPPELPRQLGDEGAGHGRVRAGHLGHLQDHALRVLLRDLDHPVGPGRGLVRVDPVRCDPGRDAAKVLDQGQPEHDGDRPELAESEGGHGLVCLDERGEDVKVDAPVVVRDQLAGDVVDAGEPGERSALEDREPPAVPEREVTPGGPDLLLDQVEVVEQPLARRRDPAILLERGRDEGEGRDEDGLVLGEAGEETVVAAVHVDGVPGRHLGCVQRQLLGREELAPKRLRIGWPDACRSAGRLRHALSETGHVPPQQLDPVLHPTAPPGPRALQKYLRSALIALPTPAILGTLFRSGNLK